MSEFKNFSDKDTLSEVSDSGTSNSLSSAEDLQKLAVILGLQSAEDVYQERFRVDRRRLEAMLSDHLEESQTANAFFHQVMSETNTLINWPARLKVGARSKKDPHVRVAGKIDDVKIARERIMQLLDTRSNRVTMKLDVSYTDHSHIIGKGGLTIKRVMEETGCHIHFPDSNRSNAAEKSNQVSVAGDMERVEKARARVRALTPLIFSFELPIMNASQPLPDVTSPYVLQIQEQYNVQVMLRTRPKLHATLVVVKGLQWEVQATMDATTLLINYMCGSVANQTLVQMSLEISPMHHSVVLGRAANQLKVIMKSTNTQIMFPDAEDPNIPTLKKSNVTITGQIKDVYSARQQLVGSLPLVVIFDLPDDGRDMDQELVTRLMQQLNVYINVRRKPKQMLMSVVIKGIERCAGDIYEARRHLLGGKELQIKADIPESYHIPANVAAAANFTSFNPFSPSHINNLPQSPLNVVSPINNNMNRTYSLPPLQLTDLSAYTGLASPIYNPPTPGGYPNPISPVIAVGSPVYPQAWNVIPPSPQGQVANPFPYPSNVSVANNNQVMYPKPQQGAANPWNNMAHTGTASLINRVQQQLLMQQYQQHQQMNNGQTQTQTPTSQQNMMASTSNHPSTLNQLLNISSQASSGYQSNFTGSTVSLDTHSISGGDTSNAESNVVSPSMSPISKSHSPASSGITSDGNHSQDLANILSELTTADRRAPGCEKKTLQTMQAHLSPFSDYQKMKKEATKAMQENVGSGYRMPTTRWSGYYFSHTSPSTMKQLITSDANNNQEKTTWKKGELMSRPNIYEQVHQQPSPMNKPSTPPVSKQCRYEQLYKLLSDIGLDKYINLFQEHEIDISTFASLSEADLVEIGITAFGARRKMLLTVAELNKRQTAFNGSAAPGAERKVLMNTPPHYGSQSPSMSRNMHDK